MSFTKINGLDKLVASFTPESRFVGAEYRKLTSSGDNYGSLLLAVDIVVKKRNEEERIHAVAKTLPANELVQKMFNSQCTFPNEVGFYQVVVPCLRDFQNSNGIAPFNCFPEFYAARVSRDSSRSVDASSVLLIKNTKYEGFQILDRTIGFDLSQSKLVLDKMAELHATVLALRVLQPLLLKEKILQFFEEYDTFVMDEESNEKMIQGALDAVRNDGFCRGHLSRLEEVMRRSSKIIPKKNDKSIRENPFFSLVHSDMWTNNIMVKTAGQTITDVKFIDFQLYEYTSLTRDVVFFIYSSVTTEVLKHNCDDLLLHYHTSLVDYLKRFNCDYGALSFDAFLQDMRAMVVEYEFFHIMTMLPPIFATSKDTKEVEQLELDSFIFYGTEVTEAHREKACFVVTDFIKRGWL